MGRSSGTSDTSARILDAAEVAFVEHGFAGARVENIAQRAGVNKQAIYYHFQSKEDLYKAVLDRTFSAFLKVERDILSQQGLGVVEELRLAIEYLVDFLDQNPNFVTLMAREATFGGRRVKSLESHLRAIEVLTSLVEQGIEQGILRPVDPTHLVVNVLGMCTFYFSDASNIEHLWTAPLKSKDMLKEMKHSVVDLVFNGILAHSDREQNI